MRLSRYAIVLGFTVAAILNFAFEVEGASLNKAVKTLIKRAGGTMQGADADRGPFFVAAASVDKPSEEARQAAYQKATTLAKKELAAFMGQRVSSHEKLERWEKVVNKNGERSVESGSVHKSRIKTVVNQLLKGARLAQVKESDDKVVAVYVVSAHSISLAKSLSTAGTNKRLSKEQKGQGKPKSATVIAVGFGAITQGRIDEAQRQARLSAQKDAVSQVLGTLMASSTQMQNYKRIKSKVFSNTAGFIEHYDVLKQGRVEQSYKMKLRATVSSRKLFDSYRSFLQTMGDPPFYVDTGGDRELKEKFSEFFAGMDLNITRQRPDAAYVIRLKGKFDRVEHPIENTKGTQLSLWIKLFDPTENKLLFTIKNDPRKAAVFYGNKGRQHDLTVKKAFTQIKKPLHKKLNETIVSLARSGRTVRVVFDKYSSAYENKVPNIQKIIDRVPGVSDSNYRADAVKMQLIFKLKYAGKIGTLHEFLTSEMKKELPSFIHPTLKKSTTNEVVLSF